MNKLKSYNEFVNESIKYPKSFKDLDEFKSWVLTNNALFEIGSSKTSFNTGWDDLDPVHKEPWFSFRSLLRHYYTLDEYDYELKSEDLKKYKQFVESWISDQLKKGFNRFMKEYIEIVSKPYSTDRPIVTLKQTLKNSGSKKIAEEILKDFLKKNKIA